MGSVILLKNVLFCQISQKNENYKNELEITKVRQNQLT